MENKHSPLPWSLKQDKWTSAVIDANGNVVCGSLVSNSNEYQRANHAHIVAIQAKLARVEQVIVDLDTQCTNGHAVKQLRKALEQDDAK